MSNGDQTGGRVLITGGSMGIGAAIVRRTLEDGYDCIVLDRTPPVSASAARFIGVDLTDGAAIATAVQQATRDGPVARIVNNVGINLPAEIEKATAEDLRRMIDVNVMASVELVRLLTPGMKAARFGRIVNITSRSALGRPNLSLYVASKAAVNGLTRSWALELAAHGVTVNAVGPGVIDTDLLARTFPPLSERREALERSIPAGHIGAPEDISGAVSFFLAEATRYVTGQVLYVCGGTSLVAAS